MTQRSRNIRRKSDPSLPFRPTQEKVVVAAELPWGLPKIVPVTVLDYSLPTGPFAGQSVLLDLFGLFERKLQSVAEEEPIEKLLNKSLQRGGDPYFDNLCRTLHGISELCLPSVINALIKWHEHMERKINDGLATATDTRVLVKKLLAVNYLFCIVLIEILPQVEFHLSACEQQVKYLLDSSFHQVQYKDPATLGVNNTNSLVVSETYAEVIGVLSETHFTQIHRQFMNILSEMKKDNSSGVTHNIISLLMAMKFVKIKTNQVEDFELGIKFLDDLGSFLLEVKDKDIKHAVAGLLVEILLPVAAQIKRETNIPALITFVCKLFGPTNELASKKQHKLAAYPLLTCLLCVSQRQFFLSNWVPFLNNTLANLKNRDSRISRVALESLYRLLWVYMIRNNYDGNSATRTRLESICGSLFPKGNRGIVPRDAPLNIFVKIIHFIAQQKLDFAFKDVIFDLLACNRTQRSLYPERMNIGIRALMVIADGLQQKDEPPSMPKSMGPSASGTMQRLRKKTYITRPLTVDIAKAIGLDQYYIPCRKAFDTILRILDTQVGRPLMLTAIQKGKEPDELLGGDVKPKLDLFRTCVAAIPRLLPEPMTYTDLIDILTRITVHIDEELRTMSGNTLQNIMGEFPEWREHVVIAEIALLQNQLTDFYPAVLDEALRLLHQMIVTWKSAAIQEKKKEQQKDSGLVETSQPIFPSYVSSYASALHAVEGLALVMLCQIRPQPKKIAISLLKEVKQIISILSLDNADTPAITVLDEATPYVVRKYIEHVSLYERMSWNLDFTSACEKIAAIDTDNCLVNSDKGNEYLQWDPWACALSGYAERKHLISRCPTAVASAWPALFHRLIAVNTYVDPSNPQNENRASLLRGSKSKASSVCGEALSQEGCLSLWQKYLVLCCAFAPSPNNHSSLVFRSFSPTSSLETDVLKSVSSSLRVSSRIPSTASLSQLFTKVAAMLRWENMTDIRDSVVLGVGSMSAVAFEAFLEDLNQRGILRDAMEKKLETNVRRRKRKDLLRLQLIRIIEVAVLRGLLDSTMLDANGTLNSLILDFVDSMRANLENDLDRDIAVVTMMRLHFSKLVAVLIDGVGTYNRTNLIPDEKKQSLFYLFTGWCSRTIAADKKIHENEVGSYVEQKATLAMTRLLMCGRIFEMQKSIGEDGYLYGWLEKLVSSANPTMQEEVEEMLALMLELNESSQLLDWLMSQSYSQPNLVAAKCFRALVRVFSRRDFPCEFISLFVLCQAMLGDASVIDAAVHMIEILKRQFLDNSSSAVAPPQLASITNNIASTSTSAQLKSQIMSRPHNHCFPIDQQSVCRNLANSYPHLTITIFSEVSFRLEGARIQNRTYLLSLLLPWIENIELVDPTVGEDSWEGPRGWGSEEATHLLLNNLMYLTVYLAPDHENEIAEIWRALALSFPANLPVILNYLYIVTVLSCDTLLPYAKRISVALAGVVGNRIAPLLLEQLTMSFDSSRLILERFDRAPYYRWKDDIETKKDLVVEVSLPARQSPLGDRLLEASEDTSKEGVRLLPMPAYSGYYSKLCKYLPPTTQPVQFFTRSQVSLLLICDIIRTSSDVDWNEATPRIFHAAVLSLDSLRPALCRHARQIIINISLLHANKDTLAHVSAMLLMHQMCRYTSDDNKFKIPPTSFCDPEGPRGISPTFARVANEEYRNLLLNSNTLFSSQSDLIMALVFCLSENMGNPLWSNEDATPRCWKVPSATQLTCLVRHLAELMLPIIPLLPVVWTQLAMRMALTTTQRHAAGRCFQIVSALCQPPGTWIPSLISRLVETAGETHDETQAYVTDLLLCLISSAPHLNPLLDPPLVSSVSPTHTRSTSYTPALLRQSLLNQRLHQERKDARLSLLLSEDDSSLGVALMRSKSADQLKTEPEGDEEAIARMQICAIAVALLESGVDNEFLLSLNLLEKVLDTSGPHKTRCLQKLEKTVHQLDWKGFNGIVGLLSRGSVVPSAYEPSIQALVRVVDVLDEPVVGGRDSLGIVVCHVLPYLLFNFDSPNHLCVLVCTVLKQYCSESLKKLEITQADYPLNNLATMLSHYSTKSFSKDRYQWTKCVLQYLCEAIDVSTVQQMIVLLAEMLEKGTASMHVYVLHMLYLLLLRQDAINSNQVINAQVVRSISRHVQGTNWREAARVYKVIVEQWQSAEKDNITIGDILSGLEFDKLQISPATRPSSPSSRKNVSTVDSSASNTTTIVRKQVTTHTRVRDRLLGLLSASGLRVDLPSAVSVVFSQSDLVSTTSSNERICTSSQEIASTMSLPDPSASITDSFPRVFKEFDFLEAEHDSVSETADSCFGWLSTMRPRSIGDEPPHDDDVDLDEDEDSESAQANSEGVGASTSRLSQTSISSDRTPCASEVDEDEDEGDDGFGDISSPASALQAHDGVSPPSAVSRNTLEKRQGDNLNGVDEESIDGSSFCCRSRASVCELYSQKTPLTLSVYIQCPHHLDGKVDNIWISTVAELQDDSEGELTAYATLLFTQLFRSCCGRVTSLLRDAMHILSSRSLTRTLAQAQDVLTEVADCPFLFVTAQYLRCSGVLSRLKLSLFELREHWETFNERKEQSIRLLNSVKSAHKLNALVGPTSSFTGNSEMELGKLLSKLFFQLMLMSDSLNDMVRLVSESHGSQAYTLSPAVLDHQRELLICVADLPQRDLQPSVLSEHSGDSLVLLMTNKRYAHALHTLRQLRAAFGQEFGCCEASDIDVLLLLFCRSHLLKAWALVGAVPDVLRRQSQCLRDANADMASAVRRLASDSASSHRTTVSSLTDSFQKISYLPD